MAELQYKQSQGTQEFVKANKSDAQIAKEEQHLIHVELEIKAFDQVTGVKTSTPSVQKFYPNEFKEMEENNAFVGYSVTVLHEPETVVGKKPTAKVVGNTGAGGDEKALKDMNKTELLAKYLAVFKKPAPASLKKNDDLEKAIQDELDEQAKSQPLSHDELVSKYKELYKEEVPEGSSDADLQEAIDNFENDGQE